MSFGLWRTREAGDLVLYGTWHDLEREIVSGSLEVGNCIWVEEFGSQIQMA